MGPREMEHTADPNLLTLSKVAFLLLLFERDVEAGCSLICNNWLAIESQKSGDN